MCDIGNKRLRILFVTPAMGVGGVGRQLYELATSLDSRGHGVKIVSLTPIGNFGQKARSAGIPVTSLDVESKLLAPVALWKIRREIQSFEPDVLHAHLYHAIVLGRLASIGLDVLTVSTLHNTYDRHPDEHEMTTRDRIYSLTDRYSDVTTFVSDAALSRYTSVGAVPKEKSVRIYNGINVDKFKPYPNNTTASDTFRWITVGNLEKQKDISKLLQSVTLLREYNTGFSVMIVGDGPLREKLEQQAKELCVDDIVEFTGRVECIVEYLNRADAFVLSSQWEGFGLVVAEAMACELPVVVTNTGGPSEIVLDGETGLIADRESPNDLAEKMERMMQMSPKKRERYGKRGRQRIRTKFDIDMVVEEWIKLYRQIA